MFRAIAAEGEVATSADWTSDFVWLVEQGNQQVGPLSTLELALAAKNGMLAADALIWRDGLPRWFAANEITGLLPPPPLRDKRKPGLAAEVAPSKPRSSAVDRLIAEHDARRSILPAPAAASDWRGASGALVPGEWSSASSSSATLPSPPADESFERLRALLRRRDVDGTQSATKPVQTTGEYLPAPRHDKPPMTPTGTASFGFTENLARNVADSIVHVLERHRIKTFDDLATGDRLRQLAVLVVDHLPGTVRLGLITTIGRAVVETKVVELFEFILFNIPRHHRQRDLRDVIEDYVPPLARAIEEAVAGTAAKVGSFVMSNISQAVAALRMEVSTDAPPPMLPSPAM